MNDQRKSYGTKDKRSSIQWICIQTAIAFLVRKTQIHTPITSGSYSRQAGRQPGWLADKIWVDFKVFKILYRLNYLDSGFIDISTTSIIVLEVYFSWLFSNKVYFRVCFEACKVRLPFFHVNPYYQVLTYLMIKQTCFFVFYWVQKK